MGLLISVSDTIFTYNEYMQHDCTCQYVTFIFIILTNNPSSIINRGLYMKNFETIILFSVSLLGVVFKSQDYLILIISTTIVSL